MVCAWCSRELTWDGRWVERFTPDPVSHGICPDCKADLFRALKAISKPEQPETQS